VLVGLFPSTAVAAGFRDHTPLPSDVSGVGGSNVPATHISSGTGSAALHMLLALAIVLALIFGLYKLLKRSANRNDKAIADDGWMGVVSSTPLAPSRSLHLVRAGNELVLVGVAEQSVTPIRTYTEDEARAAGLLRDEDDEDDITPGGAVSAAVAAPRKGSLRKMTIGEALDRVRQMTVRA
jgi:flagellar protein FliO/FliZ